MVLGIPWEIDTEGLREYMTKFGGLEDCIVMKVSPLFFSKKRYRLYAYDPASFFSSFEFMENLILWAV